MKRELVELLRDPISGEPLELEATRFEGNEIEEGILRAGKVWYPVIDGIPRILIGELRGDWSSLADSLGLAAQQENRHSERDAAQSKTNVTFSDKWTRFTQYGFEAGHQEFLSGWFVKKFGLSSLDELPAFYANRRLILEIGPGSGFNTKYMATHTKGTVVSVDISDAAVTTYANTRGLANCHVIQADLMNVPCEDGAFDLIVADGVLHHTPDTRAAVEALYRKLAPGGQFFFYLYRRMGPARAFVDGFIRDTFSKLDPEACYAACEGITELGRELSRLDAKVKLEKGIPILEIPPGEHDVQRLLYYSFLKCFWNEAFDWETNNMVNFDWYHPHNAWQHREEEVEGWLRELGVTEFAFNPANPNGISVLLRKPVS